MTVRMRIYANKITYFAHVLAELGGLCAEADLRPAAILAVPAAQ